MACAPSEYSDQPGRMLRLIWIFAGRTSKIHISQGWCLGWSEFSLGAHAILFVLSCRGLFLAYEFFSDLSPNSQEIRFEILDKKRPQNGRSFVCFSLSCYNCTTYSFHLFIGVSVNIHPRSCYNFLCPQLRSWWGILVSGCACIRLSVQERCMLGFWNFIYGFLMENYLTHVFFLDRVISLSWVMPLWKNLNEIWCMPYLMNRAC